MKRSFFLSWVIVIRCRSHVSPSSSLFQRINSFRNVNLGPIVCQPNRRYSVEGKRAKRYTRLLLDEGSIAGVRFVFAVFLFPRWRILLSSADTVARDKAESLLRSFYKFRCYAILCMYHAREYCCCYSGDTIIKSCNWSALINSPSRVIRCL